MLHLRRNVVNTLTGPKEAFSLCRKFGGFVVRNPKRGSKRKPQIFPKIFK